MTIDKSNVKATRFVSEYSHATESMPSYEGDQPKNSAANVYSENDDYDEEGFGAGSDDFNLLELAETGAEFCQVGNMTCSIPFELYDLSNLEDILSVDVWNECLTEEERLSLSIYLPDIDQLTFMVTLKELFEGLNFHFGSPIKKLFDMLKGGQCEQRNVLFLEGQTFFQRTKHYHMLRKYHNDMVMNLCQTRDAWESCKGYSINEKLRVLNIIKSQKTLMPEKKDDFEEDLSDKEESFDRVWRKKVKDRKSAQNKMTCHSGYGVDSGLELERYGKPKSKLKTEPLNFPFTKTYVGQFASGYNGLGMNSAYNTSSLVSQNYNSGLVLGSEDGSDQDPLFGMGFQCDRDIVGGEKSVFSRFGKKHKFSREGEPISEQFTGPSYSSRQSHSKFAKSCKYANNIHPSAYQMEPVKGSLADLRGDLYRHGKNYGDGFSDDPRYISDEMNSRRKKLKSERDSPYGAFMPQKNERFLNSDFGGNQVYKKIRVNVVPTARSSIAAFRDSRVFTKNDDTESDSCEGYDDKEDRNCLMRNKSSVSVGGLNNSHFPILKSRKNNELLDGGGTYLKYLGATEREKHSFRAKQMRTLVNERKYQVSEENGNNGDGSLEARLLVTCSAFSKKMKAKEDLRDIERREDNGDLQLYSGIQLQVDDITAPKIKRKKKMEIDAGFSNLETSKIPKAGKGATEAEVKTQPRKKSFLLITPTVQTAFSFSIIHLMTAVRMAMISLHPEDPLDVSKAMVVENAEHETGENGAPTTKDAEDNKSPQQGSENFPSLTILEIVSCVKSNPGDPCILETQEPLQDLIRGVLKIFSSKTSPLGAKGWKPLVRYETSTKYWTWIGPILPPSDQETFEEVTSPEAWGLPHKMLVKLVDSFANWLKIGQETRQKIESLPEPPLSLMQCNFDEKERFKDPRAQKSINTISQSSEEAIAYFRKEEFLRYSIPDRAFFYTASDGKKSSVAPLRRAAGGKSSSKARGHIMLKHERPSHVTILSLVRDATARLPGSIGTRADVCTLIRDSQYITEDVGDAQVTQTVSGALDRLHYERDPCVLFDSDRKLWVYLHRGREEEDFEDDGTSSTKKWKRPKKEVAEQPFHENEEETEIVEPAGSDEDQGRTDQLGNETEQGEEGNKTTTWEPDPAVASNPAEDNTFICHDR